MADSRPALFLGIDVGTQGARALAVGADGEIAAQSAQTFREADIPDLDTGRFEQRPEAWWEACVAAISEITAALGPDQLKAVAVDSTSGTILPVNTRGEPLRPALMYNDGRSIEEARIVNAAAGDFTKKLGYRFGASFGLPKIIWLKRHEPNVFERTWKFIHPADFIAGKLTGEFGLSDYSNALKTGFDLVDLRWPSFIESAGLLSLEKLPAVIAPGERIGAVSESCAEETGLAAGTPVVAGVSDGTAGFIASGAARPGEWNVTLGTTLVARGVSETLVKDPEGRIYCHRHPDGWWLPGGASSAGGECLERVFGRDDLAALDESAGRLPPTGILVYPLVKRGERLPFVKEDAEGFVTGEQQDRTALYRAYLEGAAYVERWILELMESLGAQVDGAIRATGGGAKSRVWLQIRADVLNRPVVRPAVTECAMGAAIVAASRTAFGSLGEASARMVRTDLRVEPDAANAALYDDLYRAFRTECFNRYGG